jgi:hypothetical protein
MSVSRAALLFLVLATVGSPARAHHEEGATELATFKAWLDSTRPGYGCDEGPAPFRNKTVEAAYGGRHFYYVLTYARGIPPPFKNPASAVADLAGGRVRPLHPASVESYRTGLKKVSSAKDARLAAAAVLILAMGDPGERRWCFEPSLFKVKKSGKGWVCTYAHGSVHYVSQVTFDKAGVLSSFKAGAPPVP